MFSEHDNISVCAQDFAVIQVWTFLKWSCNKITLSFNIAFLLNTWTETWNIVILGHRYYTKTVLAAVILIFGVCLPDFGEMQVCMFIKWIRNNIVKICNSKLLPKFWININITSILWTIQTYTHTGLLPRMFQPDIEHQNLRPHRCACMWCHGATMFA